MEERVNKLPEVKPFTVVEGAGAGTGASVPLVAVLQPELSPHSSRWEAFILLPSSNATLAERAEPAYSPNSPKQMPTKPPGDCSAGLMSLLRCVPERHSHSVISGMEESSRLLLPSPSLLCLLQLTRVSGQVQLEQQTMWSGGVYRLYGGAGPSPIIAGAR